MLKNEIISSFLDKKLKMDIMQNFKFVEDFRDDVFEAFRYTMSDKLNQIRVSEDCGKILSRQIIKTIQEQLFLKFSKDVEIRSITHFLIDGADEHFHQKRTIFLSYYTSGWSRIHRVEIPGIDPQNLYDMLVHLSKNELNFFYD